MKRKTFLMGLLLALGILIAGIATASGADDLLAPYEAGEREFRRAEIGDKIVYFHQRTIGEAIVEKDFIVYQFDSDTKALLDKKVHWRPEIPEDPAFAAPAITRELAEALVEGEVVFSQLYIVSPESDIFPLDPTPENPCWVLTSVQDGNTVVTIIDAITGEWLGYGVPPPQVTGFSLTGPTSSNPCSGGWDPWYTNARDWFETMGYSTEDVSWPTEEKVKSHIQSNYTAMFYEIAHGGCSAFASGCTSGTSNEYTYATEVKDWIAGYTKMPFTFIASCGGMCITGPGTFSYEFRKGSTVDTATVGYCGMADPHCFNPGTCWYYSIDWQTALFEYMNDGMTVKAAYLDAMADYPQCWPTEGPCMRFAGDEEFAVVPIVGRVVCITKLKPRRCEPREAIRIKGHGFGDTQGNSVVHIGKQTFDSSSPRIRLWSDTKIRIKVPKYTCEWFRGQDYRKRKVWVTVDGVDSNVKRLKVLKPATCP